MFGRVHRQKPDEVENENINEPEKFGQVQIGNGDPEEDGSYDLEDAGLNDVIQYLAKRAGLQYFHNADIYGRKWLVCGQIREPDPMKTIHALADHYGLVVQEHEHTLFVLTQHQFESVRAAD